MNKDEEHLKYLVIGHYILGALLGLISLFPVIHVVVGLSILFGGFPEGDNPPPVWFGGMFAGIGTFLILLFLSWAILNLVVARSLAKRKRHLFCMIVSGVNCLSAPVGTLLGVFTLIVLFRDSVKPMFGK